MADWQSPAEQALCQRVIDLRKLSEEKGDGKVREMPQHTHRFPMRAEGA